MTLRSRRTGLALAALVACAHPARAQRVLGLGDDASTLPAGVLRVTLGSLWDRANERYDADGKLHGLGAAASTMAFDGRFDSRLATAGPLVQALSGAAAFDASLGTLSVGRRDASVDNVVAVDVGLLSRLTIGARVRVASHAIEPDAVLNPRRIEGTMGFNPAWTNTAARDLNHALLTQFDSAVAQTTRRIAQCQGAPATAGCAAIVQNVAGAQSLVATAADFANALNALYGGRGSAAGLPFVPISSGAAQLAINQRVLGFRDRFAALGAAGIGAQGPVGGALFSPTDLGMLLTDSLYGYLMRPLRTVHAYGLGDVSVHLKARLFQTTGDDTASIHGFAVRQAAQFSLRVVGGSLPAADEPFAPVTGDAGRGFVVQSFTDLFYGSRYSATVIVGVDRQQSQEFAMRMPSFYAPAVGGVAFPLQLASREVRVTRTPGTRLDIGITPRVAVTRSFWLGASWTFSRQAADAWGVSHIPVAPQGEPTVSELDAPGWAPGTAWTEQRLALGGTYSTVRATREGRARAAFDVSYQHEQTLAGSGWRVAHLSRDVLTLRWYPRIWGR